MKAFADDRPVSDSQTVSSLAHGLISLTFLAQWEKRKIAKSIRQF